mmetsp:Transcript_31262/g.103925  ORF Transcript_31262/g.103925 Transcript_31262/m.103925 type:complete len:289 (+) Transcript_31262:920-1786(+)
MLCDTHVPQRTLAAAKFLCDLLSIGVVGVVHVVCNARVDVVRRHHLRHRRVVGVLGDDDWKLLRLPCSLEQGCHRLLKILRPLAYHHNDSNGVVRGQLPQLLVGDPVSQGHRYRRDSTRRHSGRRRAVLPLQSATGEGPRREVALGRPRVRAACEPATPPRHVPLQPLLRVASRAAVPNPAAVVQACAATLHIVPASEFVHVAGVLLTDALREALPEALRLCRRCLRCSLSGRCLATQLLPDSRHGRRPPRCRRLVRQGARGRRCQRSPLAASGGPERQPRRRRPAVP